LFEISWDFIFRGFVGMSGETVNVTRTAENAGLCADDLFDL
jgi:hypothetical protein